jgi:hypothetical protein
LLLAIEENTKLIIQQPKTSKKSWRIRKGTKLFHKSHNFSHTRREKNHIFAKLANSNSLSLSLSLSLFLSPLFFGRLA